MSLIKLMLVMVSVAAISKTFGLLRFLLRLSFLAKGRLLPHLLTLWVCKLLMLICILTKNVITSCSVTIDRKSGSAGMPRPISYAVFCLKKKNKQIKQYYGRRHQGKAHRSDEWSIVSSQCAVL